MHDAQLSRRRFLAAASSGGIAVAVACALPAEAQTSGAPQDRSTANEDLMHEHGVLRRIEMVYGAAADRIRQGGQLPLASLGRAADLFKTFGGHFHELALEEEFVFPAVRKLSGPVAGLPDILATQHRRSRQITQYVIETARKARLAPADAEPLARALDGMVWMYRNHTAQEETIVFPAFRRALSPADYQAMSQRFGEIQRKMIGADGFQQAIDRISAIEQEFGLGNLEQATAPPPPHLPR